METPPQPPSYPERMNVFLTSEHFTLQSARGLINAEINNRVNVYFTTLSSMLIASGFLAQVPAMNELWLLAASIALPLILLLGFFTVARLMVLGRLDFAYIRAINQVRQFYVQAAPEARQFLLFPPHDDDRSARTYGGYGFGFRGNLLSIAQVVVVINSTVATVALSALLSRYLGITFISFAPYGVALLILMYFLHGALGFALAKRNNQPEYQSVRFPASGGPGEG